MIKLSILIPVFNGEIGIENCLKSIKNQNLDEDEFEVIILNDGSTDNTLFVIEQQIKYFKNIFVFTEPNSGSDISRNKLIEKVRGKYIYFIDADDYLLKNALPKLLNHAIKNDLDILAFKSEHINDYSDLEEDGGTETLEKIAEVPEILKGEDFIRKYPLFEQVIWWFITKTEFINDFNIRFSSEKGQNNSDIIFANECFVLAERIAYIDTSVHRYFQSENSVMRCTDEKLIKKRLNNTFNVLFQFDDLIKKLKKHNSNLSPIIFEHLENRKGGHTYVVLHELLKNKIKKEVFYNYLAQLKAKDMYPPKGDIKLNSIDIKRTSLKLMIKNEKLLFVLRYLYLKFS
ncbi:glycosyltransferase [Pseudotamlana agarivorans]|uniref:glycosyltransferase n=1 Tax=Pseudotamlana agarivorans TaxID=481183 RepID=UPI0008314391|nr:glycosyltransferase [Tamlana agarivorans]